MTTITGGNVTLSKGSTSVEIQTKGDEENYTKSVVIMTPPKSFQNQDIDDGKEDSLIIDLLNKAEHRITVDGYLTDSATRTAEQLKADLRKIFFAGGAGAPVTLNYEGTNYTGNMDKMAIRRMLTDRYTDQQVAGFTVKFTFVVGTNYGATS